MSLRNVSSSSANQINTLNDSYIFYLPYITNIERANANKLLFATYMY